MNKIPLTRGKFALVDKEDLKRLSEYNWNCLKIGYASTSIGGRKNKKMLYMHRFIMGVTDPKISVDHINKNKLDNRKSNLRVCTHKQNCSNSSKPKGKHTSKYKGVYWDKSRNKWSARFSRKFLGRFDNEKEAARAYNEGALKFAGKYASLNKL
jgi:hypothetical protein